jgi:Lon-like protease
VREIHDDGIPERGRCDEGEQDDEGGHREQTSISVSPVSLEGAAPPDLASATALKMLPSEKPRPRRLTVTATAMSILAVVSVAALFVVPVPHRYLRLSPAVSPDAHSFVKIEGAPSYEAKSRLDMALVIVAPVDNLFELARADLDRDSEVHRREDIIDPRTTDQQNEQENRQLMSASQQTATYVALKYLGYDVKTQGKGARVLQVFPNTPATGKLKQGDVITAVDGQPVATREDAVRLVVKRSVGASVRLTITRDAKVNDVDVGTVPAPQDPGRPVIGVGLDTESPSFDLPASPKVEIDSQGIGGPSAGLVYTLAVIDSLVPNDLTGGHNVAATGEMDADGTVEPVGGLREKAIGVENAGAEYFLVPASNAGEARTGARNMKVIGVRSLGEALDFLKGLRHGQELQLPAR